MKMKWVAAAAALSLFSVPALAAQYTGYVSILEVWKNGNIAFSLNPSVPTCNAQFILNASAPGTKNQYAVVLAAKRTGTQIAVYISDTCIAAEGYGASYNEPLYIYAMD